MGARVLITGRHGRRLDSAKSSIVGSTGNTQIETYVADLASQRAVRGLAADVAARHDRLHVLINNAGIIARTRTVTEDGLELQLAVNHLAPFLLTHLLLGPLRAAGGARIVNVASAVEALGRINFADLGSESGYDANAAYCQSKLANVMFTYELARRLASAEITTNCLHPGAIATGLLAEYFGRHRAWATVARVKYPGPVAGARTSVYLASSPEVAAVSGRFFEDCAPRASSAASQDVASQRRLWAVSEQLVRLSPDERLAA
jgi:NAD(P)-dependent dehydrogenase (short-subunit alcohol dehydrogenase family)